MTTRRITATIPCDTPIGEPRARVRRRRADRRLAARTSTGTVRRDADDVPPVLKETATQLEEYFAGERTEFDVPMELDGTPFQREVWAELARIPYGETISYGELARRVGRPNGARAVGQANGRNPIPSSCPATGCWRATASAATAAG